jgi:adenylate kinase
MVKVVFVTCPPDRAGEIASHLLSQRVCACVSAVPGIESRYWWEGQLETAQESLLIIKCAAELVDAVIEKVKEVHPYEVPEILALPVEAGNMDYLAWVRGDPRVGGETMRGMPPFASRQEVAEAALAPGRVAAGPRAAAAAPAPAPAKAPSYAAEGTLPPPSADAKARVHDMKIILLGPPGVGKGTQAKMLAKRYGLRHISTGDVFLKAIRGGTKLGKEVEQFTLSGKLVPDGTTNIIVKKELAATKSSGYVLDGFPRTLAQAESLAETEDVDFAFYVNAAQEVLIARLTKRFYCDCGDSYGPEHLPAVEGLCDSCGGMLYQREDDKPRNVLTRLEEYNSKTRELLRFYRSKLHPVDGSQNIAEVSAVLCTQLERL